MSRHTRRRKIHTSEHHKIYTNVGTLMRFVEESEISKRDKDRGYDPGPYDVYFVDLEEMAVVTYPIKSVIAVAEKAKGKRPK